MVNKYDKRTKGKKKHVKGTKFFLKRKNKKNVSIIVIELRIFLKKKNKSRFNI